MNDSKNVNLDAIFNTAVTGLDAAYNVTGAALNGIQNVKDAWAANNSDSRRNLGQYQGMNPSGYAVPTRCPYPYADDPYTQNPFGSTYMCGQPYMMRQPMGYYGFTDQNYGMSVSNGYQPYDFADPMGNGGWWQR